MPRFQQDEDWSIRKKCGKEARIHGSCLGRNVTKPERCKQDLDRLYYCCLKIWETQNGRIPITCPEIEHNPIYHEFYPKAKPENDK